MPDDLQPDEGQGDAGGGLFDSYLESVPQDQRETVESYLKDASKQVDTRLQEAAEIQKTLGPYQQVEALTAYDPEALSELLAWHQQVTSSEDAFQQWLGNAAKEAGLTKAEEQTLSDAEEQGELTREEVQKLIEQAATERLAPVQQELSQLQSEKAVDFESEVIGKEMDRLEGEFDLKLTQDQKAVVLDLALPQAYDAKGNDLPMGDVSWVKSGFDRFREIYAEGQKTFVNEKSRQPQSPMTPGGTERFKPATTFEEARAQAMERFAQSKQS